LVPASGMTTKIVGSVFMDIEAACDNVLINILIEKLAEMNVPKPVLKFIHGVTSERHLSIRFDT
jgi:hypothetical protein